MINKKMNKKGEIFTTLIVMIGLFLLVGILAGGLGAWKFNQIFESPWIIIIIFFLILYLISGGRKK